jgi:ubiquinone/menaquinone biosynthesis C-methylase UbiE
MGGPVDTVDTIDAIEQAVGGFAGRSVLDIGCGRGALAAALLRRGAAVTGIDPGSDALSIARAAVPGARFESAAAEALPFPEARFDLAVFLNSLHHVPPAQMDKAIREALRVVRPGRPVAIVEPAARGPQFEVVRIVDDETEVRAAALAAIDAAVAAGLVRRTADRVFDRHERYPGLDAFLERVVSADPARAAAINSARDRIAAAFDTHAESNGAGFVLRQPLRLQVIVAA